MSTFTNSELKTLFNGNWLLKGNSKGYVVPWHNHFYTIWQFDSPSNVSRVEVEMVMPGDNVTFTVELQKPVALEKGLKFTIREGGHTVGAGVVSDVLD